MTDELKTGSVLLYSYLWSSEAESGLKDGRKYRPTVIGIIATLKSGKRKVVFFPLTTLQPAEGRLAIEVPDTEKRRVGLSSATRTWIILDEYNVDDLDNSFYIEPASTIGRFSPAFSRPVFLNAAAHLRAARAVFRARF
ncbi:MAG: hypothetical protein PHI71_14830 [Acidiphilium sp.]|nr:hypothetical protein [Acidiphilium sp.]MDD2878679.1 hypothetical protein [Acidiphilium sp.]